MSGKSQSGGELFHGWKARTTNMAAKTETNGYKPATSQARPPAPPPPTPPAGKGGSSK